MSKNIPPCEGDCLNCKRPVEKCHGGKRHVPLTPYVDGTRPLDTTVGTGTFGGLKVIQKPSGTHKKLGM